jgi:hypothetical protein
MREDSGERAGYGIEAARRSSDQFIAMDLVKALLASWVAERVRTAVPQQVRAMPCMRR